VLRLALVDAQEEPLRVGLHANVRVDGADGDRLVGAIAGDAERGENLADVARAKRSKLRHGRSPRRARPRLPTGSARRAPPRRPARPPTAGASRAASVRGSSPSPRGGGPRPS